MSKKAVANLDLDFEAQEEAHLQEVANLDKEDGSYIIALRYYQQGEPSKKIIERLSKDGLSLVQARALLERVMKENPETETTNAKILYGVGAVFAVLGIAYLVLRFVETGALPLFSYGTIFLVLGAWFVYAGYRKAKVTKAN